jgi:hypothetical protein
MNVKQVVKEGIRLALGLSDKEARAISEVANEVAKKEVQILARQIEQRKFRPAASTLTRILEKMPRDAGKLAKKLGRWEAIKVLAEIGFKRILTGGKVTARLAEYFCEASVPAPRGARPQRRKPRKRLVA